MTLLWVEVFWEAIKAPIWWYSEGLVRALSRLRLRLQEGLDYTGVAVWAKNLFVPMYGQYDLTGRLISFLVRLVQMVTRAIAYAVWLVISVFLFASYLVLPVVTAVAIIRQCLALLL